MLELVVLPEEIVAFTVTEHGISVTRKKVARAIFDGEVHNTVALASLSRALRFALLQE